jgi:hypothetical protein
MSLTDAQLFAMWGPRCSGKSAEVSLYGHGVVTVAPAIIPAVRSLNACLIAWRYETRAADTGAFNCRKKVGSNGWSVHSLKIALDINWQSNPYGRRLITNFPADMRNAIKAIRTNNGKQVWEWGGDWDGNKDAMHWQICCSPRDLATGINLRTLPGGNPVNPPPVVLPPIPNIPTPAPGGKVFPLPTFVQNQNGGGIYYLWGNTLSGIADWDAFVYLQNLHKLAGWDASVHQLPDNVMRSFRQ